MKLKINTIEAKENAKMIGGLSLIMAGFFILLDVTSDSGYRDCVKYIAYHHPKEYASIVAKLKSKEC